MIFDDVPGDPYALTATGKRGQYRLHPTREDEPPWRVFCVVELPDGGGEYVTCAPFAAQPADEDTGEPTGELRLLSTDEGYASALASAMGLAERFDDRTLDTRYM